MNINIRNIEDKDYARIYMVCREAFWNLYFPGATEHATVSKMKDHADFINELSYVIEVDGEIEGAIFYTHSKIKMENDEEFKTISFGPVFISPKYHRQKLGYKLISHTIEKAKSLGHKAILTLGFPYHYQPYGFTGGKKFGVSMADGNFYKGLLVLELFENALANIKGYAEFSEALEVSEDEVNEFDKKFPFKEKKTMPSHEVYEKACVELDD